MRGELFLTALLAAAPAAARTRAPKELPAADALLLKALDAPGFAYAAAARVQTFPPGKKPQGLGTTVYALPDGRRRCDIRKSPRKPAELIFVAGPGRISASMPKLGKTWSGPILEDSPGDQLARLKSLYSLSVSTGGRVAKRPTWRVDLLSPQGAVRRSLWVDRTSGLLMKRETYRLDGTLDRRERLTRLETADAVAGGSLEPFAAEDALSPTAPKAEKEPFAPLTPRWIPEGYLPLFFRATAAAGAHPPMVGMDYSDGGAAFTFNQYAGSFALKAGKPGERLITLKNGAPALLGADSAGAAPTLLWNQNGRVCFLAGGPPEDELVRIADSVESL